MFDGISKRFDTIFRNLRGLGKITDQNIDHISREIRKALLEADVNFLVAKEFVNNVKISAQGTKVLKSIKPGEQFINIIHKEMIKTLGEDSSSIDLSSKLNSIMLIGTQGSGKTTTASKLAFRFKNQEKKVLLVAADTYRPGAVNQLKTLGKQINVDVYHDDSNDPLLICKNALKKAKTKSVDIIIYDTAGRLNVDSEMMIEIQSLKEVLSPKEIFYVADSMTGQDMISSVKTFDEAIQLTGAIMTKLDGDSRGGAALSLRSVTGVPIKFVGVSEKYDGLEDFNAKQLADRILGFGDVVSLVEKVEKIVKEEDVASLEKKISNNSFDLNDFRTQIHQMKKMGSMTELIGMIPGISRKFKSLSFDENQLVWTEAIINSMTPDERTRPEIINTSRKKRIALGSGRNVFEINSLLKKFLEMKKMMKKMNANQSKFSTKKLLKSFR
ncbi:signal recognition particle protein [bacterium]|jgi:signal recognition particle subunit SRP54|nr:signal recognition particle protein [bacterium]MBT4249165.1 signal recognition particle protein [bacterium]MBT4926970.1 signal recognition particle protein [bacterium]MBT6017840.1 signal recognition particle protein [bacterium]